MTRAPFAGIANTIIAIAVNCSAVRMPSLLFCLGGKIAWPRRWFRHAEACHSPLALRWEPANDPNRVTSESASIPTRLHPRAQRLTGPHGINLSLSVKKGEDAKVAAEG